MQEHPRLAVRRLVVAILEAWEEREASKERMVQAIRRMCAAQEEFNQAFRVARALELRGRRRAR